MINLPYLHKFARANGACCPKCGRYDLENEVAAEEEGWSPTYCNDCGFTWIPQRSLVGLHIYKGHQFVFMRLDGTVTDDFYVR